MESHCQLQAVSNPLPHLLEPASVGSGTCFRNTQSQMQCRATSLTLGWETPSDTCQPLSFYPAVMCSKCGCFGTEKHGFDKPGFGSMKAASVSLPIIQAVLGFWVQDDSLPHPRACYPPPQAGI